MRAIAPRFTGRLWPNGEGGVSRQRETPSLLNALSHFETNETRFASLAFQVHGYEKCREFWRQQRGDHDTGLSLVSNSPNRKRRGLKGITSHGKKLVRNAGEWMEKRWGIRLLSFGTVTVPRCTREEYQSVAQNWSVVVKAFVKNLGRDLARQCLPTYLIGSVEVQEERFQNSGIPALHLHFCFVGRLSVRSAWLVTHSDVRDCWKRALAGFLPEDTNWNSCENVVPVKRSVAGYLGKYMSKGVQCTRKLIDSGQEELIPSAWYTCSHELRRTVKGLIASGSAVGEFLEQLCCNGSSEMFAYLRPVEIVVGNDQKVRIGWCFRIHPKWLDVIYRQCKSLVQRRTNETT